MTLAHKEIEFDGKAFVLHGLASDPYFGTADPNNESHQFFRHALKLLRPDAIVCDIGANIGLTALMAAQYAGRVYCFEPGPGVFGLLSETIRTNGLQDKVETINLALGNCNGRLSFFDNQTSGSASHIITDATLARESTVQVRVTTLDAFVAVRALERLDLIKIDIEGFEIDALTGAMDTVRSLRPSALIEFNAFTMVGFRNINPRELLAAIRAAFPYVYRWIGQPRLIASDDDALNFIHDNLVSAGCVDDLYGTFEPIVQ